MHHIIIDKLFKKPSLLASAKHYRVEYVHNTLYVLQMSKARPKIYLSKYSLNGALAHKMLDAFEAKFEQQYEASLWELDDIGLANFCHKKNCFAITNPTSENILLESHDNNIVIITQGKKVKLYATRPSDFEKLKSICNLL
jgi:hypothetical protein